MDISKLLMQMQDKGYQSFTQKLIPTLPPECIIGVRIPQLRVLAAELLGSPEKMSFLEQLPHFYHEENLLHAFFIEKEPDFEILIAKTEIFLPCINNWAVCDSFSPRLFKRNPQETIAHIKRWMAASHPYTQRFGMGILLSNYLDSYFEEDMLDWVASIRSDEYYVKMMQAWYFATALTKQYEKTIPMIVSKCLDSWTHNKTIQKAIESRLISLEHKQHLRELKRK